MPPRFQTLRPAQTASAREAMRSFFCDLCQKGYSRMNEYEAHLSSYDHSHKQRLKDMKAMVRDPNAVARARRQEAKADGVISIKLGEGGGASSTPEKKGFRKGGFKSAFVSVEGEGDAATAEEGSVASVTPITLPVATGPSGTLTAGTSGPTTSSSSLIPPPLPLITGESDTEDEGYEMYDPRKPTP